MKLNSDCLTLDLHPRTLRRNIWAGLLSATDQEIRDGMDFYPGAHGLCRLFSLSHPPITTSQVAGIYAALSPLNTWDTNVANILDILRYSRDPKSFEGRFLAGPFKGMTENEAIESDPKKFDKLVEKILSSPLKVNTPHVNRDKALKIASGADPSTILKGRKVTSFWRAISDPSDTSHVPVDRHLICLALGVKVTSNQELRSLSSNRDLYLKIERAYLDLGDREGIGNRLAAIAWFVQRRISKDQLPIYHPDSPVCHNRPMWCHGIDRFYCSICKSTRVRAIKPKSRKYELPDEVLTDSGNVRYTLPLSIRSDGRILIHYGKHNPFMNESGWQYLSRYVIESHLGKSLRPDEHVHHVNGILADCRLSNLEVWLAERHGRYHAKTQLLYMFRDRNGRFAPNPENQPVPPFKDQYLSIADQSMNEIPF